MLRTSEAIRDTHTHDMELFGKWLNMKEETSFADVRLYMNMCVCVLLLLLLIFNGRRQTDWNAGEGNLIGWDGFQCVRLGERVRSGW